MKPSFKDYSALHTSAFFFGMTGMLGKLIQSSASQIVFYRCLIAASLLFFFLVFRKKSLLLPGKSLAALAFAGFLIAVHWFTFFLSAKYGGAAIAAISFSCFPFFLTYLEPLLFKQKVDFIKVTLSLFLIVGVVLLTPEFETRSLPLRGIFFGIISGFFFAILSLYYRKAKTSEKGPASLFWQMFFAGLFSTGFIYPDFLPLEKIDWLWLGILGSACTLGAHGLFIFSLKKVSAQSAGIVVSLEGVYGAALGILVLGEAFNLRSIIGALLIIAINLLSAFYDNNS